MHFGISFEDANPFFLANGICSVEITPKRRGAVWNCLDHTNAKVALKAITIEVYNDMECRGHFSQLLAIFGIFRNFFST